MCKIKYCLLQALFLVSSVLFLVSCEENAKSKVFSIALDVVMKQNDSIHVFYTTNDSINFTEEKAFWKKIKGKNKNQTVNIDFPQDTLPKQLRFDFGRNVSQKDIVINKITLIYKSTTMALKGKEIFYFFRVDDNNTIVDKLNGSIKRKNPKQQNGPSLYPKGNKLFNTLNQLYSEK